MDDRDTPRKSSVLKSIGRFFGEIFASEAKNWLWALRIGAVCGAVAGAGFGAYFFGVEGFAIGLFAGAIIGAIAFWILYLFASTY